MSDVGIPGPETRPGDGPSEEPGGIPLPADVSGERGSGSRPRRVLSCLGVVLLVLVVLAGGIVWLFRGDLFHPFGDDRACRGSDLRLPRTIRAAGATIPDRASDVHYFTSNGVAEVSFVSTNVQDYVERAGITSEGKSLFDKTFTDTSVIAGDVVELPAGLCGPSLRGPVFLYGAGAGVTVTVEGSPLDDGSFRFPARAVVTFHTL